jgi:16S rRNA (guanine527-N7)-methyltransferase
MPSGRSFDAVSLRAVDKMQEAVLGAAGRVGAGGWLVLLTSAGTVELPNGFMVKQEAIPGSMTGRLVLASRVDVPRGTVP